MCGSFKEAIIWYEVCILHDSNRCFFSTIVTQPIYTRSGVEMPENQKDGFNWLFVDTLNDLVAAAATANSAPIGAKKFATKEADSFSELKTLYTLAQCAPNLSGQDYSTCIPGAPQHITSCCLGKQGGQVMYPRGNLRFELFRFYYHSSVVSEPHTYPPNESAVSKPSTYLQLL